MTRFRLTLLLLASLFIGTAAVPAFSDDDHDLAREALQRGEIKPLSEILTMVQKEMPGEIVEVDFERDDGLWLYELKMIDPSGRFMKVYVDAANNSIVKVKAKHARSHRGG